MDRDLSFFSPGHDRSILVLTCVDGALREDGAGSCGPARATLEALRVQGVPTVLTSHHRPAELIAIQRELGLREPFIAESGRSLYIPRGYFVRLPSLGGGTGDWEVLDFVPPSVEAAVEMLIWLYRMSGDSPLLVGIGVSGHDRPLLRHVDVPVVIHSRHVDQRQLRTEFPQAYVTQDSGPCGWREAVLGTGVEESGVVRDQAR